MQQTASLGDRHHRDRIRQTVCDEVGSLDRVHRDVHGYPAFPDLFADEQHRRFVALAFSDDDAPGDLHLAELGAHGFHGGAVGGVAFAPAHEARGCKGSLLRHVYEIERVDHRVLGYKGKRRISFKKWPRVGQRPRAQTAAFASSLPG